MGWVTRSVEQVKTAYYEIYFIDRALAVTEANDALVAEPALYSLWRE